MTTRPFHWLAFSLLAFLLGCGQPALQNLAPDEQKAVDLAQAYLLATNNTRWGQPVKVEPSKVEILPGMHGDGVYLVTYPTPASEIKTLGDRAIVVNLKTGRVEFVPRC